MASNQVRGTPGLLLLGFAILMLLVAVWGWKNRRQASPPLPKAIPISEPAEPG